MSLLSVIYITFVSIPLDKVHYLFHLHGVSPRIIQVTWYEYLVTL